MTEETSSDSQDVVEQGTAPIDSGDESEGEQQRARTFSEDEVEAIVKKRLARDRRKRAKEQHEPEPKRERKEFGDSGADAVMAELRQLRAETELNEAIEDAGINLSKKMRSRIKRMFRADGPEDVAEWLEEIAEDLGITQASSNPSNERDAATSVEDSDEPKRKAVQDFGPARRAPQDFDAISNPNELTRADIEHMQRKYGKEAANRKIRLMAEEYYKGRRLPLGG